MSTLAKTIPNSHELVTEILDHREWPATLKGLVKFLQDKGVEQVRIEYGFVLQRDLAGKPQPLNQVVQLGDLERVIQKGLDEGTIEWGESSDFLFFPICLELGFMLCNDADLHFASPDPEVLCEVSGILRSTGVKVYDSGGRV